MGITFLFVLYLLGACGVSSSAQFEKTKPWISYDNDTANQLLNGSLVLGKGDNLTLNCSGYDSVEWIIEQEDAKFVGPVFQASRLSSINITADSTTVTLTGFELEYNYTGQYICRYTLQQQLNNSIYVFVSEKTPRISYGNDNANQLLNGSLVLGKRDNLILNCSGYSTVEWVIEQEEATIVGPDFRGSGLYGIRIRADSRNATLLGFKLLYYYTGRYVCRYTTFPQLNDSIYVFVSDQDNPFLSCKSHPIEYIKDCDKLILPCRTTDPRFEMSLKKEFSDVNKDKYTFDPKVGVIIDCSDMNFDGMFTCSSQGKNKKVHLYELRFFDYWELMPSSHIVDIGESFHIRYSVFSLARAGLVIEWSYISKKSPYDTKRCNISKTGQITNLTAIAMESTRIYIDAPNEDGFDEYSETLYVENATMADGGVYRCTMKMGNYTYVDDVEVRVIEKTPRISYGNDNANQLLNGSLVLGKRDNLILNCSGYSTVEWVIEQEEATIVGPDFRGSGFYSINIRADSRNATLLGFKLLYYYTGRYVCRYTTFPQLNDSIYVFVSDQDNPFLSFKSHPIEYIKDCDKQILPCRTTDPRFEMSLKKDSSDVNKDKYTFDPKVGVIIDCSDMNFDGIFTCSSQGKNKNFHLFDLRFFHYWELVPSSHIVLIGESFHIRYSVFSLVRAGLVVEWSYISKKTGQITNLKAIAMESTRIYIDAPNEDGFDEYSETLYVENATMADGGVYRCTMKIENDTDVDDVEVRVIDKTFVTSKPLKTEYITKEGLNIIVMEVTFDAYPKPKFEWYKDNTLISTPQSVSVTEDRVQYAIKFPNSSVSVEYTVQYSIEFPNRTHAGNYTLKAYTADQNVSITMELIVEYTPVVKINSSTDELYLLDERQNLTCMAESVPPPDEIDWYWQPCENLTCTTTPNAWQKVKRSDSPTHSDRRRRSAFSALELFSKIMDYHSPWMKQNISVLSLVAQKAGWIKCVASNTVGSVSDIINFLVTDVPNGWSFKASKTPSVIGDNVTLICKGSVWKFSSFQIWNKTRADYTLISDGNRTRIATVRDNLTVETQVLISPVEEYDKGFYECVGINHTGQPTISVPVTIEFANPPTSQGTNQGSMEKYVIIGVCVVCVVLIVVLIVIMCVYRKRSEKMHKELEQNLLQPKGDYNPELPIDEQTSCIAYDPNWEFPKERLRLGMVLGQGAFGRVVKAVATEIVKHEDVTCVAVKMVKDCTDREQMMSLLSELKIFIHIGQHLNVLSLLGAVTKNIAKGELYVIVEYCHFGNLRNYLIKHKDRYKDIVSDDFEPVTQKQSEAELDKAKQMPNYVNKAQTENTNDLVGPPLTKKNLILWAFEVGRGMEYLASKKYIHRDLAARNVLLAEDNVLKICDFGLSKDCYKYVNQEYHQKGDVPVPIKWMALESLTHKIYTTKSDVWSYGVFLWELFALGGSPYPGVEFNEKFITLLKDGYRMEKPEVASDEIYEVMRNCWTENPNDRPTFSHLVDKIGDLLEYNVKQYYLDLGKSDLKMNDLEPDSAIGHDEPLMQDGYLKMNSISGDNTNYTKMTYPAPPPDGAISLSSSSDNEDKDGYVRVPTYETKENGDTIELQCCMPTTIADDQAQMENICGKIPLFS